MALRFRVKGWLSREEFETLTEFARYAGRSGGLAVFEVDPERMRRSGYTLADVAAVLQGLEGAEVVEEDLEALKRAAWEESKATVWLGEDGWLYASSRRLLKPVFEKLGFTPAYDRSLRAFRLPPHWYARLVEALKSSGFPVEDRVGLLEGARLPRRIEFRGQLREYQEEALKAWEANGGRGVIALPTGAGKTVVAIAAAARLGVWTLVVVYTKEHIHQWIQAFQRFTDAEGLVGAYYGEEKRLAPITVTTYQTAYRKTRLFAQRYAFLVFDEAHHLPADKFKAIASSMPAPYRMGLSATIEREDGKHEEVFPLVGGVVYHTTPGRLTSEGYLAPFTIRLVKVELSPERRREYERLRREYQRLAGGRSFQEVLAAARKGDPTAAEALRVHARMRELVQEAPEKLEEVERIVRSELAKGSKIIVFTQYRKQAEELARRLGAHLIHGEMDAARRKRELEAFKSAERGVLVVTTVGDEGLDIPDANVGVFVSGTGSRRQYLQRLGRLLRPSPGKKAVLYEVVVAGTSEEYQARRRRSLSLY
ncbi:DEAD/DEAH box helicase family protein [Stetteria hydrogenophila]